MACTRLEIGWYRSWQDIFLSRRTSLKNLRLLTLARDLKRRKARERRGLFVAEGVRTVEELVNSDLGIEGILAAPQLADAPRGAALLAAVAEKGIALETVSALEFASAAETESPQGVLGLATIPEGSLESLPTGGVIRLLVLDAVQDPGNVGTIIRTAAALGATAVVALPGTVDLWNAKVVRSGMGSHFKLPLVHCTADDLATFATSAGLSLWGADAAGSAIDASAAPVRLGLVVGNEGGGLSAAIRSIIDRAVSIPMAEGAESLNVAVAAGILLHQVRP